MEQSTRCCSCFKINKSRGYTKESLVDVILTVEDNVIMNYLHNLTQIEINFPIAKSLDTVKAKIFIVKEWVFFNTHFFFNRCFICF